MDLKSLTKMINLSSSRTIGGQINTKDCSISHIGIIPDGARRWARINNVSLEESYARTMSLIAHCMDLLFRSAMTSVSVYLASADNLSRRNDTEVTAFLDAELSLVKHDLARIARTWNPTFTFAGAELSQTARIRTAVRELNESVSAPSTRTIFLLVGYDPMHELQQAVERSRGRQIQLEDFWVPLRVDAVIRSGGENRLSNFLPIQSAYAELFFLTKLFPDIDDNDITNAIVSARNRDRRQGS